MKIVILGSSGLIGSKLVKQLRQGGDEVVEASLAAGVNTLSGEGLDNAFAGAQVVVDVTNSPSFEAKAVLEFFETSGATSSLPRYGPASHITWRCRWSAPSGSRRAVISGANWPRKR